MTGDGDLRLGFNTRVADDHWPHTNLWGLANGLELSGIKPVDLGGEENRELGGNWNQDGVGAIFQLDITTFGIRRRSFFFNRSFFFAWIFFLTWCLGLGWDSSWGEVSSGGVCSVQAGGISAARFSGALLDSPQAEVITKIELRRIKRSGRMTKGVKIIMVVSQPDCVYPPNCFANRMKGAASTLSEVESDFL